MQCRYKVTIPNFTQVFEVGHVDNPCISLVLECRLQPRRETAMLANVPPRLNKMPYENWRTLRVGILERSAS